MTRVFAPFLLLAANLCAACTMHHSKQALSGGSASPPGNDATFVTEEDAGLMLLGLVTLSEPDHYALLLERARRRFRCARMHHAQLDFFTEHWLIVAFPVARVTLICEREPSPPSARAAAASP